MGVRRSWPSIFTYFFYVKAVKWYSAFEGCPLMTKRLPILKFDKKSLEFLSIGPSMQEQQGALRLHVLNTFA